MGIELESWKMYFDGATNQSGNDIGVLLIYPKGTHIPFSGRLNFLATNNATEYEDCIMGLQAALSLEVKELEVYDALATMASMMDGPKEDEAQPIVMKQKEESAFCMSIEEDKGMNEEGEWYSEILQYLKDGTYPKSANKNDQLSIRRLSTNYIICGERLYRRSYDEIHLLCVTAKEAQQIIEEELSYGPYMNAHMLSWKIIRQGYY
ncbi:uncharacterized protein LOC126704834 [Quercus robur]|uniref:uncharacterized protein LOC126704834 n=1 Tax=Quercus robur TaxID=38942 RepID=UPI002162193C|nr:uncharacterized protein LOC126704834 [Quercus robur]